MTKRFGPTALSTCHWSLHRMTPGRHSETAVSLITMSIFMMLGLCVSVHPAQADVAPDPVSGGVTLTPSSVDTTEVAMTAERVQMRVSPGECDVDAVFTLANTGKAVRVEVGFPYHYPNELREFKAWVDGIPAKVSDAERNMRDRPPDHPKYEKWKLWNTFFGDKQKRTIRVTYSTIPQKRYWKQLPSGGFRFPDVPYPEIPDSWHNEEDATALANAAPELNVRYVLWSGRPWKGPIGHCLVEVDCADMKEWKIDARPEGFTHQGTKYVWDLKNYEPDGIIHFRFRHNVPADTRAAAYKQIAMRHLRDFDYCATTVGALLDLKHKEDAFEVARASLSTWKMSDAQVDKFYWGQVEPKYFGALKMAHDLLQLSDRSGDKESAAEFAKTARRILNAELALLPADQRRESRGWPCDDIVSLCKRYGVP